MTLQTVLAWLHGGKRRRSDWTVHDASGIRWFLDVRFRRQHARRVLRLFDRTRLRFRRPHRRPVGARGRCERPAQHGRGLQPHQSGWLVPRPYAGRAACADGGLGNPCGRFQQSSCWRFPRIASGQVSGVHRRRYVSGRASRLSHGHRISQETWRHRGAAHADLRFRFRGRRDLRSLQLGVRSGAITTCRKARIPPIRSTGRCASAK